MNGTGTTLYRGITPKSLGLDVHGGYGETWSRDFEDAKSYARPPHGYVLEAILHPSAKQLLLITEPDEQGYAYHIPESIQELAQLVKDPWLYNGIMADRYFLWDEWRPKWTKRVKKAGYDSIFTRGFDGPEEYVLNANLLQFIRYHRVLEGGKTKAYPIESGTLKGLGYVVGLDRTRKIQVYGT
jgi:hypothetical protein